ncbi:MAG: Ig-like domain-containing protein [Thermomicrobiales bacterium]
MTKRVADPERFRGFLLVALISALGLVASSGLSREASAQPYVPELEALCVNPYTGVVSAPLNPDGGTTCGGNQYPLLIPDSFPITLSINPWTGAIHYTPYAAPGPYTIQLPDDGIVPLCFNPYTGQLRHTWSASCPGGMRSVLIVGEIAPDAVDDGPFTTPVNVTLNEPAPGLLANDDPGFPEATVVSFGFGSPPATAAGTTLVDGLAGGDLTVNADGSFSLANPTSFGIYSFQYRIENSAGFDDATVTIVVQQSPVATDDGLYTTLEGQTLTVLETGGDDLLDNDTLGFPEGEIVSFGGGSLAGDATTTSAGTGVALAGGTLTVNADGSLTLANPTVAGDYSFDYLLENAAGSDDASVTIQVQRLPDASDDSYTMPVGTTLTVLTSDLDDLLDNDDPGFPATDIDSFGGGDAPGDVTNSSPTDAVAFAGGTLTVNADGSFTLLGPDQTGVFTFNYRLTNAAGTDDATVTIEIQGPPAAVDDGPASDSSPGDLFHTVLNTTLDSTVTAGDDNLLSNDDPGFPEGEITSFGGGDLGGTVTSNSAGETALIVDTSGSVTVNADGSFVFVPPAGFTGTLTFQYRLTNDSGSDDAAVTIAVGVRPSAIDDSYTPTVLGNVLIDTSTSTDFSVLTNDTGDALTFASTSLTSISGGNVTLNADGTFEYDPPAGYEGADSFTYTVDNGFNDPQPGTVSLTVTGMLCLSTSTTRRCGGRWPLEDPFNCLVGAGCFDQAASDEAGDRIFPWPAAHTPAD